MFQMKGRKKSRRKRLVFYYSRSSELVIWLHEKFPNLSILGASTGET